MLYLDKYSIHRLMEGREHPHFVWSTITANLFVYAQALKRFFSNPRDKMRGSYVPRNMSMVQEKILKLHAVNLFPTTFFGCKRPYDIPASLRFACRGLLRCEHSLRWLGWLGLFLHFMGKPVTSQRIFQIILNRGQIQ